jgi:hypothetical protein
MIRKMVGVMVCLVFAACAQGHGQQDGGSGSGQVDSGPAPCGSVLGVDGPFDCAATEDFGRCCAEQGGAAVGGCATPNCNHLLAPRCFPPAPMDAGVDTFACWVLTCAHGQVCNTPVRTGDQCLYPSCVAPRAPCDVTPTCDCYTSNYLARTCDSDDAGNITVHADSTW